MKKLISIVVLGLAWGGISYAFFHNDKWDGWVYPNANNLNKYISVGIGFKSLEDCRNACLKKIAISGYQNADYECGLNCKPSYPGADTFICKKTSR